MAYLAGAGYTVVEIRVDSAESVSAKIASDCEKNLVSGDGVEIKGEMSSHSVGA